MEFTIGLEEPFSLDYTLESGQVFRWERKGEWWRGVVSGGLLKVRQEPESIHCETDSPHLDSDFVRDYFRLDDDLPAIFADIMVDETIKDAITRFYGLRLIRQDRWECLASFILATNSNIPRIRRMISSMCDRFGDKAESPGESYSSFPSPEALAEAKVGELRACGLGYRAPHLRATAKAVAEGGADLELLYSRGYEEAREGLTSRKGKVKLLPGVGPKVADCALLFSGGKDEAFPIDVWVARLLTTRYPHMIDRRSLRKISPGGATHLSTSDYRRVSAELRRHFGRYAGYAQQYLFMASRSG